MAPFSLLDKDDGLDENDFMTIKQYRILNRKLNVVINSLESSIDNEIKLTVEVEKYSFKMTEQMENVKKDVKEIHQTLGVFQNIQTKVVEDLSTLAKNIAIVDLKVTKLDDKVSVYESTLVEGLHKQLQDAQEREADLQKKLDAALLQSKQLGEKIHNYDPKDLFDAYNQNVVKHVSIVQRDLLAKLQHVINLASRLPVGVAKPSMSLP